MLTVWARTEKQMMKKLALIALVTACGPTPPEGEQQWTVSVPVTTDVQTAISFEDRATFSRYIQQQIAVWNDGLVELGCEPPFEWTARPDAPHIRVVLAGGDIWETLPPNGGGYYDGRDIFLRADLDGTYNFFVNKPSIPIAQHELGHALGLPHNMRDDSVMSTQAFITVQPGDLEDAARSIGCMQ